MALVRDGGRPCAAGLRLAICLVLWTAAWPGVAPLAQDDPPWRLTLWRAGDAGTPLEIRGHVKGVDGGPVAGARVAVRHAGADGVYGNHSGEMVTNQRGEWLLRTVLPGNYGHGGHIHLSVMHAAHAPVFTEVLFAGDQGIGGERPPNAIALEEVRVGERRALVGNFEVVMGR